MAPVPSTEDHPGSAHPSFRGLALHPVSSGSADTHDVMQKRLRRLPLRRLATRATSAIRRRPRAATAALTLAVLVAFALGGSLFLVSRQAPAAAAPSGQPTFTYAGGWSLAELQRHLAPGDITAISGTSSSPPAGNPPNGPVAKNPNGQRATIKF